MTDLDDIKIMDTDELVVLLGQLSAQLNKADERLAEIHERVAEARATRLGLNAGISAVRTELDRRYSNMLPIELTPLN